MVLVVTGLSVLHQYNVTWDEALGDFFFGERYLSYLTTFDAKYLDFAHDPYPADHVPDLRPSLFRSRPWEYWPVANIVAAATSRVLSGVLGTQSSVLSPQHSTGWLDPFDGFHAANLLFAACLLIVLYRFAEKHWSASVAATAVCLLFLMPRVFADMVANIKDFPEMALFALTLFAFHRAWESASMRGLLFAGALWGLAIGTKANALFIAPVIVIYIAMRRFPEAWSSRRGIAIAAIAASAFVAFMVMFAAWPWLWADPIARLQENLGYVAFRGRGGTAAAHLASPWTMLLLTTPPVVLLLIIAGLVPMVRGLRDRKPAVLLLTSWIVVVLGRLLLPGAINFDGVRHFLEIMPPLAVVAAIGAAELARIVTARVNRPAVVQFASIAIPVALCASSLFASHPFETAYWNAFAGGLRGAQQRGFAQSSDYWAASYRLGLDWLNENAPKDSLLVVPIAGHTVQLVAPVRLRTDIKLVGYPRSGGAEAARQRMDAMRFLASKRPLYVMFVPRRDWSTELDRDCEARLRPAAAWTLDDAPVLLIYRYVSP
jgi:hypothetical protein